MSTQSSTFPSGRQLDDCRPQPDLVVFYDGSTADKPVIEGGVLLFNGGISSVPNHGIGGNARGAKSFGITYQDIAPGDAGVKIRCATTETKLRLRFNVVPRPAGCDPYQFPRVGLHILPVESCATGTFEYCEELPIAVFRQCNILETDCQITEALVKEANAEYGHFLKAYQTQDEAGRFCIDLEVTQPGRQLNVVGHDGLTSPRIIVPANKLGYTREIARDFFGTAPLKPTIYSGVNGNLPAVEITYVQMRPTGFSGAATSNMAQDTTTYTPIRSTVTVLFEDNANAGAARTELIRLLKGPGGGNTAGAYLSRLVDDTCADQLYYFVTVARTDDKSNAAFASIMADYPMAKVTHRAGYLGGKSYYELHLTTADVPAAAKGGDDVQKGTALIPYEFSVSACPPGTACADCK